MKKSVLIILTICCALCCAFGLTMAPGAQKAYAEKDPYAGTAPTFGGFKYNVSTSKGGILLATAIKDYDDCYEVGYQITVSTGEVVTLNAATDKYYTSIVSGLNEWTVVGMFGEDFANGGMIVWEIEYNPAYTYTFNPYARVCQWVWDGEKETYVRAASETVAKKYGEAKTLDTETHDVSVVINGEQTGWGSLSASSVDDVAYGTAVSTSSNTLTIGGTTVTATPAAATEEYTYFFSSWSDVPETVTSDTTITANFVRYDTNQTYYVDVYKWDNTEDRYKFNQSVEKTGTIGEINPAFDAIAGYLPNKTAEGSVLSGTIDPESAPLHLKHYYDTPEKVKAIPIAGTEGKAFMVSVDDSGSIGSNSYYFTKQDSAVAGVENAYLVTDNRSKTFRIVGATTTQFKTLKFRYYTNNRDDDGPNLTVFPNSDYSAASLNAIGDVYYNGHIRMFNEYGVAMTCVTSNQWVDVEIDLTGTSGLSAMDYYDSINYVFRFNASGAAYIANASLSNDDLNDAKSPIAIKHNGNVVGYMLPVRFNDTKLNSSTGRTGANDSANTMAMTTGTDGVYEYVRVATTGGSGRLNRLMIAGIDRAYLTANSITKLTFDIYVEDSGVNFRSNEQHCTISDDDSAGKWTFTGNGLTNANKGAQKGYWYKVTVDLTGVANWSSNVSVGAYLVVNGTPTLKGLEFQIFTNANPGAFRIANVELS